ncbi:hypothetical protein [Rheinheimera sp.]|uniref:hypothetical protein n=1 Tax=Rheinheimera sp. TaxID=1869214 RepID=UPI00273259DC|nr:hypothetical protein [Rheinheimera sp.]MDP2714233.1 hypothetical protein [Rheinheimera sp.]
MKTSFYFAVVYLLSLLLSLPAHAWGWLDIWKFQHGHVLARGLVMDDNGQLQYVEYAEDGTLVEGWSHNASADNPAYVLPAAEVDASRQMLSQVQEEYQGQARLMTAEEFNSAQFKTVSGAAIPGFSLPRTYKSVLVKPQNRLLSPNDNPVLLLAKFNLKSVSSPSGSIRSMLFDRGGNLIHQSPYNIAFKSAYYEGQDLTDPQKAQIPSTFVRLNDKKKYAPVNAALVEVETGYVPGITNTDQDGKFFVRYAHVPCPCFDFHYDFWLTMKYYYSQFTSTGVRPVFSYGMKQVYDSCIGYDACPFDLSLGGQMARVAVIGILAAAPTPAVPPMNFYVDTGFIAGAGLLQNPDGAVGIGGATQYVYKAPDLTPTTQTKYDFDGDGKFEYSLLGNLVEGQFVCVESGADAEYQGVYFSSLHSTVQHSCADSDPELTQPDVLRLADTAPDFSPQGLVGQIATADLQDTDIFVFRESTGMLITRRQGITAGELANNSSYYGVDGDAFNYQIMIRAPAATAFHASYRGEEGFAKFQSAAMMNPELHRRAADHLKPSEAIKIVLLNRKTGYIGTKRTSYANIYSNSVISFPINNIIMQPPNLKISVERRFSVQEGMSKDDPRNHLIAYESSAMSNDDMLVLTTEWYDADGTPLPDALADYGFTGRLARVAGPGQLTTGGQLGHFAIRPGKHIEHIRLQDDALPADHYYVQVSGQPSHQSPDFSGSGAGNGPLAQRPSHYVPFLVPVLDEAVTLEQAWLYKKLKEQGQANDIPKPEPVYRWVYRPELQFSTYQLKVQDILREQSDGLSSSLYGNSVPMIATSDNLVRLMYGLLQSNQQALAFLGAGQQLVFALGEHEIKVRMGDGQQLIFDKLEHLASLDVADFVTLRLYNNNDPTNVLWEYAFETLAADTRTAGGDNIDEDGTYYVSADEPVVPLQAVILGYANRENKQPLNVSWTAEGAGAISNVDLQYKEQGVFPADIELMPITGSRAVASAGLDAGNQVKLPPFVVVPGKPANMHVSLSSDSVHMRGHQQINVQVSVKDAHGNAAADGTSVSFALEGHAVLTQSDEGTQGGVAHAVIIGGNLPDNESALIVRVAEMEQRLPFSVKPLQVQLDTYPQQMQAQQSYPVTATVTDSGGAAVGGIDVMFVASAGRFANGMLTTDGSGRAEARLHSGFHNIANVEIVAMVGPIVSQSATSSVRPEGDNYAQTHETVVIGDEAASGIAEYERFDGLRMGIPFETRAEVQLIGKAGDTLQLELGSLSDPNLQPIASYNMSDLHNDDVTELNGLHGGVARHITLVEDNPTQTGSSYRFAAQAYLNVLDAWESSSISVPASPRLKPANSSGFRLDMKLEQAGGSIFSLEGGVQQLQVLENGSLEYTLYTSAGKQTVTTEPLQNGKWYTVAGRYKDNRLELEVSDLGHYHTAATGGLKYSISQRGLTIGEGLSGNLSALKFYNWDSAPLLTFADGSTRLNHTLQSVEDSIEVVSTGALNQNSEQLQMLRVGFSANQQQSFVGVVSKDFFSEMMVFYAETNKPDGYPDYGAYNQRYTPFPFIGVANAWGWDYLMEKAGSVLIAAIGLAIPYQEAIALYKQIRALAKGEDVDYMDMTLNALAVISVVPGAQLLRPLSKGLKAFLPTLRANRKFFKAIGGVLSKIGDDVLNRRFDTVMTLLPFLLVIGEMVADSEAREGAMLMFSSIASADDILAWAEYFSLPADGWDGDGEPPKVDTDGTAAVSPHFAYPFMGQAYAAKKLSPNRVRGLAVGKALLTVVRRIPGIANNPGAVAQAIKGLSKGAKGAQNLTMRKIIHSNFAMLAAVKVTNNLRGDVRALIVGRPDQRVRPELILASILYLELNRDELFAGSPERDKSLNAMLSVYSKLFVKRTDEFGEKQYHGAAFHLLMLAFYQMQSQFDGMPKAKAIESIQRMDYESGFKYQRTVDILLEAAGEKTIVELKSFKDSYVNKASHKIWSGNSSDNRAHLHKEFFTDVLHSHDVNAGDIKMQWRFQTFVSKNKVARGPKANQIPPLVKHLCQTATGISNNEIKDRTGLTKTALESSCEQNSNVALQSMRTLTRDFIRNGLFMQIDEEKLQELLNDLASE